MDLVLSRAGERKRIGFLSLFFLVLVPLSGYSEVSWSDENSPQPAQTDQSVEGFLDWFWSRPLASQGKPLPRFSHGETSLAPGSCGVCHAAQFNDWSQSLHSRAMGPGIMGQLVNMPAGARGEHQLCIRCHAPLNEQADSLLAALTAAPRGQNENALRPSADRHLHEQGLVCAACHVRNYQWYGPPRRDGSLPSGDTPPFPHNAWRSSPAFEDSRFCAACHQFKPGEYALNGKLLENTYEEWKASRYAREGKTCQSCHMPNRRHLWRGIHDPRMVKEGVEIRVTAAEIRSGRVSAGLTIKNTGTGHYFPTYVTPNVVAEGYQEDAAGKRLHGTEQHVVIARQVPLDLSEEIADTRIAPDEQALFEYRAPLHPEAVALVFRVRVEPDAFYAEFYRALLEEKLAGRGENLIRQALENATASAFTLYLNRQPLKKD